MSSTLQHAIAYQKLGWPAIPLQTGQKTPTLQWEPFTKRLPTDNELQQWFGNGAEPNIGLVTGSVSGLLVLDVDDESAVKGLELPPTPAVQTSRGTHYYFRLPSGKVLRNSAKLGGKKLDIRAEHGYVVAPPSRHPSGRHYTWAISPRETPLAPPPAWLENLLTARQEPARAELGDVPNELPERFAILLEAPEHGYLLEAWEGRRKPPRDQSRSGYDQMLACLCVKAGLKNQEIAGVLRNYKFGRGLEAREDYIA